MAGPMNQSMTQKRRAIVKIVSLVTEACDRAHCLHVDTGVQVIV
jgi:hypothetical protein